MKTIIHPAPTGFIPQCAGCGTAVTLGLAPTFADCPQCGPSPIVMQLQETVREKEEILLHERSMYRYKAFLPLSEEEEIVTMGEGWTPMVPLPILSQQFADGGLMLKDESMNPTGSFKARGLSMAITKAKAAGVHTCIVPTAGNAGGAAAAYCARAGIECIVVMPAHTPDVFKKECELFGAETILVEGLISDCGRRVQEIRKERDCFDLSTMKEPYRLEGKKTLGYEIAEQYNWKLPDLILYPTGGGTGLIGIWKAFEEMKSYGWIKGPLPRMIAVQAEACQPLAQTFYGHQSSAAHYNGSATIANGLAVPRPFAERMMLRVLKASGGTVITVSEKAIRESWKKLASAEGVLVAPEGAALLWAYEALRSGADHRGIITTEEKVLLLNTGSGYKYLENW